MDASEFELEMWGPPEVYEIERIGTKRERKPRILVHHPEETPRLRKPPTKSRTPWRECREEYLARKA